MPLPPRLGPPLPELPPPAPQLSQVPQAVEAIEVIDLTGVSDDEDEDEDRDNWEDVADVVDLTNLPSDDDKDDANDSNEELDGLPLNYTIPNLRPRRHALVDSPPLAGQTCSRRAARVPARVPVRRDICELCARVVRWGPGYLVTKHHLYPQEITRKYPDRYTQAERGAVALLCRPCHDACHRAHSNRILADFYFSVDLLKADPHVQAHIRTMQRATTPELIARHGDGVHVRRRKERRRAAMTVKQRKVASRYMLRKTASRVTVPRPSPPPPPPPPPPGVRRSARLLAKSMGGRSEVPVIVIEDEDEDMQDAVIHVDPKETENEGAQDIVSQEELLALEARGEYIPL
ncbi:putative proline-specific permease [Diaporthe ampelina]|uniref:Putative proline-specific permease n=1 Tax=Diaporthe ampelina TaxID=1214573 RepID=A0A0G2HM55_9PEZI|nr:putative proline-specific permease [Diaporthe ampelina]